MWVPSISSSLVSPALPCQKWITTSHRQGVRQTLKSRECHKYPSGSGLQSLDYLIRSIDQGRGHQEHWCRSESFQLVSGNGHLSLQNLLWIFEVTFECIGEWSAGLQQLPPGEVQLCPLLVRECRAKSARSIQQQLHLRCHSSGNIKKHDVVDYILMPTFGEKFWSLI